MARSTRVLLIVLVIAIPVLVSTGCMLTSSFGLSITSDSRLVSAVLSVMKSEAEGARREQIQSLGLKLNQALELMQKADEAGKQELLDQSRVLLSQAEDLLNGVTSAANTERALAAERASQQRILAIILVPVLSAIITVAAAYTLRYVRARSVERLFRMRITGGKNEQEK